MIPVSDGRLGEGNGDATSIDITRQFSRGKEADARFVLTSLDHSDR